MMKMLCNLKYLTIMDWGWLGAKSTIGLVLPVTLMIWAPLTVKAGVVSGILVNLLLSLMLLGGVLSITGILLRGTRIKPMIVGYALEVGGISALLIGTLILGSVYGVLAVETGGSPAGAVLCGALAAPFLARLFDILFDHLTPKAPPECHTTVGDDEPNETPEGD